MNRNSVPRTLLVAEDEPIVRMALVEVLKDAGYSVLEASDGKRGQVICSECRVDLLISDIKMPGASGYELADTARKFNPEVRIILLTGYTKEPLPEGLRQAHIRIIRKPFEFQEILAETERLLFSV